MPQICDYYNMAKVLSTKIDHNLSHFFEESQTNGVGMELQAQMAEWRIKAKSCPEYTADLSFLNYIWFVLSDEDAVNAKEPREKYYQKRRQARIYWVRVIKKEKAAGFKEGMLHDDCLRYFEIFNFSKDDMKAYASEQEYLDTRFTSVEEWGKEKDSNLIAFPEITHLKQKKIAEYFLLDCQFKLFDYILKNLRGDVVTGYYTMYPQLVNDGLFSFTSSNKEMTAHVQEDAVIIVDDVNDKYNTVVSRIPGNFKDFVDSGTQNELVASLVKSGKLSLNNAVLDALDQNVFVNVYSSFSVGDLTDGKKIQPLSDIVKSVYGKKLRRENYMSVLQSLRKMARYKLELKESNSQGNFVSSRTVSFFDLDIKSSDESESDTHIDASIVDGYSKQGLEELTKDLESVKDLSTLNIGIEPSYFIRNELKSAMNEKNIKILTSMFDEELPIKDRKMLEYLVEVRTSVYPSINTSITYEVFVAKLRLNEPKKKKMKEQIATSIGHLKEHGSLISDFKMNEYSVDITFIPLNDVEKRMYKLVSTSDLPDET